MSKKIDPETGKAVTFEQLSANYKGKYKKAAIQAYWDDECKAVKEKGKAKAKAEPKAKAKAAPTAKSDSAKPVSYTHLTLPTICSV